MTAGIPSTWSADTAPSSSLRFLANITTDPSTDKCCFLMSFTIPETSSSYVGKQGNKRTILLSLTFGLYDCRGCLSDVLKKLKQIRLLANSTTSAGHL